MTGLELWVEGERAEETPQVSVSLDDWITQE